jgi:hypothetical protein
MSFEAFFRKRKLENPWLAFGIFHSSDLRACCKVIQVLIKCQEIRSYGHQKEQFV